MMHQPSGDKRPTATAFRSIYHKCLAQSIKHRGKHFLWRKRQSQTNTSTKARWVKINAALGLVCIESLSEISPLEQNS